MGTKTLANLRVLLISDPRGNDDEGMKKIARNLASRLRDGWGVQAQIQPAAWSVKKTPAPDIVHYVGGPTYRSVLYTAWIKKRWGQVKTILTFSNPIWGPVADLAIRLWPPDCVIVQSSFWKQWADRLAIPAKLLPFSGVDLERFKPAASEDRGELRRSLNLPPDKLIALHVGHLKEDRNLQELLKLSKDPDIQMVIVGSTSTARSEPLISQLKNGGCLVFQEYQPEIEKFYQAADCYVFPTVDPEGAVQIPLSILEALASNLPVITTPFGGLTDFFQPGNGMNFIEPAQFRNLPVLIKSAVLQTTHPSSLVQDFSWEAVAGHLYKIYAELLGER